jgi:putative peptidoglycan lipid II flippase
VLFPQFARLSVEHDNEGLSRMFTRFLGLALVVAAFGCVALIALSEPLIRLLYQRGAFSDSDTSLVSTVQTLFAIQLPFHIAGLIAVRLLSALQQNHILLLISSVMLVIDIVANYVLMQTLGVAGIALSTSFVFVASFILLMIAVLRALPTRPTMVMLR